MKQAWIVVALASLVVGCSRSGTPAPVAARDAGPQTPREVRLAPAEEIGWERSLRVTGELVEHEAATLSTKVAGRVAELSVDLGTRVKRGEPIATIEARDYELRVQQAEAALAAARALLGLASDASAAHADGAGAGAEPADRGDRVDPELTAVVRKARAEFDDAQRENRRLVELQKSGVSAQAELDASSARLAAAESGLQDARELVQNRVALVAQRRAELALARQQLADTRIVAPFDGVVAARSVGTGDYLVVGAEVARLVRDDPLRLRLSVREVDAPEIAIGQLVRIALDGFATPFEGRVARLSPTLDPRTRMLTAECELQNPEGRLRPGSFARAEIVVEPSARTLSIPLEALVTFAGIDKVIVMDGGVAKETRIVVGRRRDDRIEVLSGLAPGAQVVLAPGGLQTGAPISAARVPPATQPPSPTK
ncbi:MAG: efflux RND transporter periplasmic adaptor subunit [Planctomycetes bacterium]|nr:efflux RND transporter periplasmic adaptor subunit [Planctomycetota bacterium]